MSKVYEYDAVISVSVSVTAESREQAEKVMRSVLPGVTLYDPRVRVMGAGSLENWTLTGVEAQ